MKMPRRLSHKKLSVMTSEERGSYEKDWQEKVEQAKKDWHSLIWIEAGPKVKWFGDVRTEDLPVDVFDHIVTSRLFLSLPGDLSTLSVPVVVSADGCKCASNNRCLAAKHETVDLLIRLKNRLPEIIPVADKILAQGGYSREFYDIQTGLQTVLEMVAIKLRVDKITASTLIKSAVLIPSIYEEDVRVVMHICGFLNRMANGSNFIPTTLFERRIIDMSASDLTPLSDCYEYDRLCESLFNDDYEQAEEVIADAFLQATLILQGCNRAAF